MSATRQTLGPEYFDALYAADPDPWKFAASPYERNKYELTLDAMPKPRYRSALEVGCSIGILTRSLASRCDTLVAIDAAQAPLLEARRRCADLPGVRFEQMFVPDQWPDGAFELILLSVAFTLVTSNIGKTGMDRANEKSLTDLKREAERSRAELAETVDQLRSKVSDTVTDLRERASPDAMKAEVGDYFRPKASLYRQRAPVCGQCGGSFV